MLEDIKFNSEFAMDPMMLDYKSVLHMVDFQTPFSFACFLSEESSRDVWLSFTPCCSFIYSGYPHIMRFNQRFLLTTPKFEEMACSLLIQITLSGNEIHISVCAEKSHHGPQEEFTKKQVTANPRFTGWTHLHPYCQSYERHYERRRSSSFFTDTWSSPSISIH